MKLGDIGALAEAIEKALPEIARNNNGEDIRKRITVSVEATQEEIDGLNAELYEMTTHRKPSEDLEPVGEVELDLVGIRFVISSPES